MNIRLMSLTIFLALGLYACASSGKKNVDAYSSEEVRSHAQEAFSGKSSREEPPARTPLPPETKVRSGGKKPLWIDGHDPAYSDAIYLTAVGIGSSRESAEEHAYAALSKIFSAKIESTTLDQQQFLETFNEKGKKITVESQSVEELNRVTTDKVLTGVRIAEIWHDKKEENNYALALLEREPAARSLGDQLEQIDSKIAALVQRGDKSNSTFAKFAAYRESLDQLQMRNTLNAELRLVDPRGSGIEPPIDVQDLINKVIYVQDRLLIGLTLEGSQSDQVGMCLMEAFTQKGMKVTLVSPEHISKLDVLIRCSTRFDNAGDIQGAKMIQAHMNVQLLDVQKNQVIQNVTSSKKVGRKTVDQSIMLGVSKLCSESIPEVVEALIRFSGN